jgi:hypothetical protein
VTPATALGASQVGEEHQGEAAGEIEIRVGGAGVRLLSIRQRAREHWYLIADLVGQLVVISEHVRCGTSSLEHLRRLQERLDWEGDRIEVEINNRYLERKGVRREKTNGRPVVYAVPFAPGNRLGADPGAIADTANDKTRLGP